MATLGLEMRYGLLSSWWIRLIWMLTPTPQRWKDIFDKQLPSNPFEVVKNTITDHLPRFSLPLGEGKVKWTVWLSKDALWSRLQTLSHIAVLKGDELENAKKVVEDALKEDDVERNEKGEVAVHGVTYYAWTDRL